MPTPAVTLVGFLVASVVQEPRTAFLLGRRVRGVVLWIALGREPAPTSIPALLPRFTPKLPVAVIKRFGVGSSHGCERNCRRTGCGKTDTSTSSTAHREHARHGREPKGLSAAQHPSQGRGIPPRMVVLLSLATAHGSGHGPGALCEDKETGGASPVAATLRLAAGGRRCLEHDRYYCSYFLIALLMERGVEDGPRCTRHAGPTFDAANVWVTTIT